MSDEQVWPGEGAGPSRPSDQPAPVPGPGPGSGGDYTPSGPSGQDAGQHVPSWPTGPAPFGHQPGQHGGHQYGGQPPFSPGYGPGYSASPYGPPPFGGHPYGTPPAYGPVPPFPPQPGPAPRAQRPVHRALQASAAALVLAAAVVAGAGISRVVWPSTSSPTAGQAPITTVPANGGTGGLLPNGGGGTPGVGTGGTSGNSEGAGGPSDVSAIAQRVDPAIVDINVVFNYQSAEGAGTGIVLTPNGEILTNNHVINGATKISVTDVGNGKTYAANVVGYDNTHDVAVLQLVGASGLATAKISSSSPSMGEAVVAIGNAGGLGGTPTSAGGSVTALDQSISASDQLDGTSEQLSGLLEVNANVESGDSGGPLVNASGQVIGMDTAASSNFAFSASGNQGFAIPISQAMSIARQAEAGKGSSTLHVGATAFLGVLVNSQVQSAVPGLGQGGTGYANVQGAQICFQTICIVSGGSAAKLGLQPGDIITSFAGHTITSAHQLTHDLVLFHPGQLVSVSWVDTAGQAHHGSVRLAGGPPA